MTSYADRNAYIRDIFAPETPELKKIRSSLTHKNDQIIIEPEDGKTLQLLIKMIGAKKIIEIGTLAGYSTLWIADALPSDGKVITLEKELARAKMARENLSTHPNIEVIEGDALQTLPTLCAKGPFDFIFIDADKIHYLDYLDWAEKNIRKGGLIVGDNTLLFDAVWNEKTPDNVRSTALHAMRTFNQRLADPAKYASILIPTAEGMTIGLKLF